MSVQSCEQFPLRDLSSILQNVFVLRKSLGIFTALLPAVISYLFENLAAICTLVDLETIQVGETPGELFATVPPTCTGIEKLFPADQDLLITLQSL